MSDAVKLRVKKTAVSESVENAADSIFKNEYLMIGAVILAAIVIYYVMTKEDTSGAGAISPIPDLSGNEGMHIMPGKNNTAFMQN